jgi:Fe-S-cluster containining protein
MGASEEQGDLMMDVAQLEGAGLWASDGTVNPLQRDFERGLRFAHVMMSINQHEGREGVVFARALAELLVDKGVVGKEELETMMAQVGQQLEALPTPKVRLARSEDKYSFDGEVFIDCASRVHLCKARCCAFAFYLTEQDLDEGIVRWDYGRPYWIQTGKDGYCAHCEPGTWRCRIHAQRPYVCRAYDCRNDQRIWLDFEHMVPNSVTVLRG